MTEHIQGHPARWWHALPNGQIQCDLCPRNCRLHEGQRGACFVRQMSGGIMRLTTYGRSSGFCIDPIEKKPLDHFYPGSSIFSFGTAGCNLTCSFCQNWDISKSKDMDRLMAQASPAMIADAARQCQADSVAYTYNDPIIFAEYALDTAIICKELGIYNVAVTAGYIHPEPARAFFSMMDAANVDLKSFNENFYHKLCSAHLKPVLDTLVYIKHHTSCWLEITTLLIPGHNDSPQEITELATWIFRELGPEVPVHFTAFSPAWKMPAIHKTPLETLNMARKIAMDTGLHYVYTGNVHDTAGGTTHCPGCQAALIVRDWHKVCAYHLTPNGRCPNCNTQIAGRFRESLGKDGKAFGPQRIPVRFAT